MNGSVSQVYVVDNDLSVREAVGRLIGSAGLNVKTFATAQEVLANLGKEIPSCLVLDILLPGLDGFELQDRLTREDIRVPIIFLTGHGDIPMSVRAIKAGAIEFLTKPFSHEDLFSAIDQGTSFSQRIELSKIQSTQKPPYPEGELPSRITFSGGIVGRSAALRRVLQEVDIIAPTNASTAVTLTPSPN